MDGSITFRLFEMKRIGVYGAFVCVNAGPVEPLDRPGYSSTKRFGCFEGVPIIGMPQDNLLDAMVRRYVSENEAYRKSQSPGKILDIPHISLTTIDRTVLHMDLNYLRTEQDILVTLEGVSDLVLGEMAIYLYQRAKRHLENMPKRR